MKEYRMTMIIPMNSEKKHSVRYDALDMNAGIQSVYIMRSALSVDKIPQKLIIEVKMENEE